MEITRVVCGMYAENAYLVTPEGADGAFFVDPGDDLPALRAVLAQSGRRLCDILLTHGHFDHMLAARALREETGAKIWIGEADAPMLSGKVDNQYASEAACLPFTPFDADAFYPADGETIRVCGETIFVLHTPGHTPGGVCLRDARKGVLFSGDTLFARGFGRTDMEGGDMAALRGSLRRLTALDAATRVLPGHMEEAEMGAIRRYFGL